MNPRRLTAPCVALTLLALVPAPASADIFVSNRNGNAILVFADDADGNVAPIRKISGPLTQIGNGNLNGIALDVVNEEVFVSVATNRILVFDMQADGNVAPLRQISGAATGMAFPAGIAVDPIHDELFVANSTPDGLLVFPRGGSGNIAPLRNIQGGATGINQPTGVFVHLDDDEIFLTNEAAVVGLSVFPRTGTGNIPPLRTIMGPATTFGFATGNFQNPDTGEQLVADLFTGRVLTFPEGSDGNLAPTGVLISPALDSVAGITLTHAGEMLVNDLFGDALLGFDVTAAGSTAPGRDLCGPLTQLDAPIYVVSSESPFPGSTYSAAPPATVVARHAGLNHPSFSASGPPVLGSLLSLTVDVASTGDTTALLVLSAFPGNTPLPNGQVFLMGEPFLILDAAPGPLASFDLSIPLDLSLAGLTASMQAAHISGGPDFELSNGLDLTLGL